MNTITPFGGDVTVSIIEHIMLKISSTKYRMWHFWDEVGIDGGILLVLMAFLDWVWKSDG